MKIVINSMFGGFSVPDEMQKVLNCDKYSFYVRDDPRLIEWVEKHQGEYGVDLAVVEIPNNATDWRINDVDGRENIEAVIDGKIIDIYAN